MVNHIRARGVVVKFTDRLRLAGVPAHDPLCKNS